MRNPLKTKWLFALALIFSAEISSFGQSPVINVANSQAIGDSLIIYRADTSGLSQGPPGAGITWDFSTLDSIGVIYRYTMLPSSTPYPSLYPAANRAERTVSGSSVNYQFYNTQNDSVLTVGTSGGVIDSTIYRNPDKSSVFPFTYLNSFYDSSIAFSYYNTGNLRNHSYHSRTVTADGYGTLILPNATYSNVLRYKITHYQVDSLFSGSSFISRTVWNIDEYIWIDQGYRAYLLYVNPVKIKNGLPQAKSVHYVRNPYPVTSTGLADESEVPGMIIYPNPFSGQAVFRADHSLHNARLTVYDGLGQVVKELQNINGQTVNISREGLRTGLYFIRLAEDNKTIPAGKFIIAD